MSVKIEFKNISFDFKNSLNIALISLKGFLKALNFMLLKVKEKDSHDCRTK
ncbi:hypothetical protein QIA45_04630 (plasmid) [Borreliella andersonii]|uniref:Uncharacterized protein n=1 Tax=Borrelia andersonii TaxID=42109 RepID=A0ABZ0CM02_BORAD|nr:hypothetical protein [Borreliella andersonii]WNY66366.1 hypothetical protein QIA45_04630 [Borreliella andersonii]